MSKSSSKGDDTAGKRNDMAMNYTPGDIEVAGQRYQRGTIVNIVERVATVPDVRRTWTGEVVGTAVIADVTTFVFRSERDGGDVVLAVEDIESIAVARECDYSPDGKHDFDWEALRCMWCDRRPAGALQWLMGTYEANRKAAGR